MSHREFITRMQKSKQKSRCMGTNFHAYTLVFTLDLVDGVSSVGIDQTSYSISKITLQLI